MIQVNQHLKIKETSNLMSHYPTHLYFDSSGSAEFFIQDSRFATADFHIIKGFPQHLLACPDSIGLDGKKCICCNTMDKQTKNIAFGWDLHKEKHCLFISTPYVFSRIQEEQKKIEPSDNISFIFQRTSSGMLIETLKMDLEIKKSDYEFEDYLKGLQNRSYWTKFKSANELKESV